MIYDLTILFFIIRSDIQIQSDSSNFKYSTYDLNSKGKLQRKKQALPNELGKGQCKTFDITRTIRPCEKNFHQIRILGSQWNKNAENNWYFKDRECDDFSFEKLPLAKEADPTKATLPVPTPPVTKPPTPAPVPAPVPVPAPAAKGKGKGKDKDKDKGKTRDSNKNGKRRVRRNARNL